MESRLAFKKNIYIFMKNIHIFIFFPYNTFHRYVVWVFEGYKLCAESDSRRENLQVHYG